MPTKTVVKATIEIEIELKGDRSADTDEALIRGVIGWIPDINLIQSQKQVITSAPRINHTIRCSNQLIKHSTIPNCCPVKAGQPAEARLQLHCYMGKYSNSATVYYYGKRTTQHGRVPTACLARLTLDEMTLRVEVRLTPEGLNLLKTKWNKIPPAVTRINLCAYNHKDFAAQIAKVTDDIKGLWNL